VSAQKVGANLSDEAAVELVSVTVREATQVVHEGVVHPGGSTVQVPADVADKWQRYGFLSATAEVSTT
jgi:hypothetical protein